MKMKIAHKSNGINMDRLNQVVDAIKQEPERAKSEFRVKSKWIAGGHCKSVVENFYFRKQNNSHKHRYVMESDEPELLAGSDKSPNPVEHLLNSLASCLTSSMVYHAALHGIQIYELEAEVSGDLDLQGFMGLSHEVRKGLSDIKVNFRVKSDIGDTERLKALAEYSPVYDVLCNGTNVEIEVAKM